MRHTWAGADPQRHLHRLIGHLSARPPASRHATTLAATTLPSSALTATFSAADWAVGHADALKAVALEHQSLGRDQVSSGRR